MRRAGAIPVDHRVLFLGGLVLAVNTAIVLAAVGGILWLSFAVPKGYGFGFFFLCFAIIGATAQRRRRGKVHDVEALERVGEAVRRLCITADCPEPRIEIVEDPVPLSWTTAVPGRRAKVVVTTRLLAILSEAELEAVLAHELSHIAQHDTLIMTLAAAPGIWVLRGVRASWRKDDVRGKLAAVLYGSYSVPLALLLAVCSRLLSRFRELGADRGAAVITGSPAALASALLRLSRDIHSSSPSDLRAVAAGDPLHVLPARAREPHGLGRLWATHPPLRKRIAQLQAMEAGLQRPH
jgi:heat shock protein HtpX